ncbi:MAG TPA: hypothetical protein V6D10_03450 [Trichocoleus sp.]
MKPQPRYIEESQEGWQYYYKEEGFLEAQDPKMASQFCPSQSKNYLVSHAGKSFGC